MRRTIQSYFMLSVVFNCSFMFGLGLRNHYMIQHGLSDSDIVLVAIAFVLTKALADVPTGALADVFGRRKLVIASCALNAVSLFSFVWARNTLGFCVSNIICGVGAACGSGAFEAWFVDQLTHQGYTEKFDRFFSREAQFNRASSIVAGLVGGWVADRQVTLPWTGGGIILIFSGIIAAIVMREDYRVKKVQEVHPTIQLRETLRAGIACARNHRTVRLIILLAAIQWVGLATPDQQWTPLFEGFAGHSYSGFGILWALMMGAAILGSLVMEHWVRNRCRERLLIGGQVLIGLAIAGTVATHSPLVMISIYLFHEAVRGGWHPIKMSYLNEQLNQSERATVASCESSISNLGILIGLGMGLVLRSFASISLVWIIMGLATSIITLIVAWAHKRSS